MFAEHAGPRRYGVRKGAWSEAEDAILRECIDKYGEGKWHLVPLKSGLNRCRKSCRLRWVNYLKPNIRRGEFSEDEVDLLVRLHKLLGNRWSLIAGRLPGRTANDVKNYWNTHLRKKTMVGLQATDPRPATTHAVVAADRQRATKAIKPRPRTFAKSLVQCMRSKQQQQAPGLHTPAATTTVGSKEGLDGTNPLELVSATDDAVEQIQWWKSLLDDQLSDGQEVAALASGSRSDGVSYKICAGEECKERLETRLTDVAFDTELWDFLADDEVPTRSSLHQGL